MVLAKLSRIEKRTMDAVRIANAHIDLLHNYKFSLCSKYDPAMKQIEYLESTR